MPSTSKRLSPRSRPAYRGGYVTLVHTGPWQKGGGLGGILKGWFKRAIPIVKAKAVPLAKSLGRDLAVHTLDSVYNVGRDILVNKKDPLAAVYDQGKNEVSYFKNKITHPFQTVEKKPATMKRRPIKRRTQSNSVSLIPTAKRRRANRISKKVKGGFKKITL